MNEILQMILGHHHHGGIRRRDCLSAAAILTVLRQMRGVWLVLSLVPLAVMVVVGVVTALALSEGANLWPLLLRLHCPRRDGVSGSAAFVERRVTRRDPYPR